MTEQEALKILDKFFECLEKHPKNQALEECAQTLNRLLNNAKLHDRHNQYAGRQLLRENQYAGESKHAVLGILMAGNLQSNISSMHISTQIEETFRHIDEICNSLSDNPNQ